MSDNLCKSCKQPISEGASRCDKCQSPQGNSRFFQIPISFLALLISCFTFVGFAIPIWNKYNPWADSNLEVMKSWNQDEKIVVLVKNKGTRPAAIINLKFWTEGSNSYRYCNPQQSEVIPPNTIQTVFFTKKQTYRNLEAIGKSMSHCVEIIPFKDDKLKCIPVSLIK